MPPDARLADVECVSTVDLTSLINRRLVDAERNVWEAHRNLIVTFIKDRWQGWRYKGRPPYAPRNVSYAKWASRIETTEAAAALIVFNQARSWNSGKPYVAYVRRTKGAPEEWRVLWAEVVAQFVPPMREALLAEVLKNVFRKSEPKRLHTGRGGPTVEVTL